MTATILRGNAGTISPGPYLEGYERLTGVNGPITYTNTTGGNVRVIINYVDSYSFSDRANISGTTQRITMSWGTSGNASVTVFSENNGDLKVFGKNLNPISNLQDRSYSNYLPSEVYLRVGDTFSITCRQYNIIIIPEDG
jgi:hypothetical protein